MERVVKQRPVRKRTLAEVITTQLRQRIVDGSYTPGAQLSEVELATRFDTSRGPVREAIQRLVQEGLLVSHPHRGVFVPELTYEDINDLFLARGAVERAAMLELIGHGVPAKTLAQLEQQLGEMARAREAGDWSGLAAADLAFHEAIVEAARSPRLNRMYSGLAGETRLGLNILVSSFEGRSDYVEEHRRIFDLLASGNRAGLLTELDRHFQVSLRTLHRELEGSEDKVHWHDHDEHQPVAAADRSG